MVKSFNYIRHAIQMRKEKTFAFELLSISGFFNFIERIILNKNIISILWHFGFLSLISVDGV